MLNTVALPGTNVGPDPVHPRPSTINADALSPAARGNVYTSVRRSALAMALATVIYAHPPVVETPSEQINSGIKVRARALLTARHG
jgi:hypothetical protein